MRVRIKHVLERLARRLGYETVQNMMPAEDQKLLSNIRKQRERLKREKKQPAMEQPNDEVRNVSAHSAFERALYSSDSDNDSAIDGDKSGKLSEKGRQRLRHLVEAAGEPLDLLDPDALGKINSRITQRNAPPSKKNIAQTAGFKRQADGKFVFESHASAANDNAEESDDFDEEEYMPNTSANKRGSGRRSDNPEKHAKRLKKEKEERDKALGLKEKPKHRTVVY